MDAAADPSSGIRLRRALGRIRRRFALDTFDVFVREVPDARELLGAPDGYELRWASAHDVARCEERHTELDERERREGIARLELGHRCVIALSGDTVVFSVWENPRNLNVPELLKHRLAPHQSFIYKAFTSPEHRGRHLYEAGMRFVLEELRRAGKGELVGYAHVKKDVSRRGLARLAFASAGRVWQIVVPGWRRTFVSRALAARFPEELPRSRAVQAVLASGRT
jgi:hypothetical protein